MMSSVVTPLVKPSASPAAATANHQSNDDSKSVCYSCVDDHQIPPCAGFSQDYSCLPNAATGKARQE